MSSSGTPSLSPSSSLSSPSLRSSPFSVLFPELTQLIIEHTVPLTFQTFTYQSRQSTLRSICLVSKLFHHLARPLLLATLWISPAINRREQEGIHVKGDDKLLCRELVFETLLENWTLGRLGLAGYVGLRTLVISGDLTRFDLSTLSELSQLSVLRLSYVDLSASGEFCLPKLYEMSFFYIVSIANHAQILNSSTLPSLRLLAFHGGGRNVLPVIEEDIARLLPQLHVVSLSSHSISHLTPDLLSKLNPITLFDAGIQDLAQPRSISHVRFKEDIVYRGEGGEAAQLLAQDRFSRPSTIFFPLSASPSTPNDIDDQDERTHLLQVCTSRGIEVIYEDTPVEMHLDSAFSERFILKMKEERRKKEEKV